MRLDKYLIERSVKLTGDIDWDTYLVVLNKWDKDLEMMTKAYRSIKAKREEFFGNPDSLLDFDKKKYDRHKSVKDFEKMRKAFKIFRSNFAKWITNIINKENLKKYTELQKLDNFADIFIDSIGSYELFDTYKAIIYDKYTDKMVHVPGTWDMEWRSKEAIDKYQKAWILFKNTFREVVIKIGGTLEQLRTNEKIMVSGVTINAKNITKKDEEYLKMFIEQVRKVEGKLKKEGFGFILRDLNIELNFDQYDIPKHGKISRRNIGGLYNRAIDKITMLAHGGLDIHDNFLIHELGHRFWYKYVPEKAKNAWERMFEEKMVIVDREYLRLFFKEYFLNGVFIDRNLIKNTISKIKDPSRKIAFEYLESHIPNVEVSSPYNFMKSYIPAKVPIEFISNYAKKSGVESFAEAFKIWVGGQKRRLGEWTRAFFKEIVETGGVHITEDMDLIDKYLGESTSVEKKYPLAGSAVDGRKVMKDVPNMSSIGATLYDYEILKGVRVVKMKEFDGPRSVFYAKDDFDKAKALSEKIKENKMISPLIIVVDNEGPYILEGAHRYVALYYLKAKAFPAIVVIDNDEDE